jgi:hypothetical protein
MSEQLTHWKKLRNPDYMGAYSMPTDGSEIVLTIRNAKTEKVAATDGKKSECLVIYFQEQNWKPMILNATNAKAIQKVAKTPYIEKWAGVRIQIYVAKNVKAFGEEVDALRIRTVAPKETSQPAPLPTITPEDISDAQFKLEAAETLDQLAAIYKALTPQMQAINEIKDLAVKLKAVLTNANP